MKSESFSAKELIPIRLLIFVALALISISSGAQTLQKKTAAAGEVRGDGRNVEQELVRTEMGFFEAWKTKNQAYFREHMQENGIFWGEAGTFSRDQQLQEQQSSAKSCAVEGYGLSDFGALPLAPGAYLLTYTAEQYATCNGEKMPVHINGSSIYVLKNGKWQAIYRAEVPLKNPS
jgi:hypothetical protein